MTNSPVLIQDSKKNYYSCRYTKRLCMIACLCLLLSTVLGQAQVSNIPWWNHRRSGNGIMQREPLFIDDSLSTDQNDKDLLGTPSSATENSISPTVHSFKFNSMFNPHRANLTLSNERIRTMWIQEKIPLNLQNNFQTSKINKTMYNKNNTMAEKNINHLKRQINNTYNNKKSSSNLSIPYATRDLTNDRQINNYYKDDYSPTYLSRGNKAMSTLDSSNNDIYDENSEDEKEQEMYRAFRPDITIKPDEMEPREIQEVITNEDIIVALTFPVFLVLLLGATIYVVQKARSYYFLRWERYRRHIRRPIIPLNNLATTNEETAKVNDTVITGVTCEVNNASEGTCEKSEKEGPVKTASVYNLEYIPQSRSFLRNLNELENTDTSKEPIINLGAQSVPRKYSSNIFKDIIITPDVYDSTPSKSCITSNTSKIIPELDIKETRQEKSSEYNTNVIFSEPVILSEPDMPRNTASVPDIRDESRSASFITSNISKTLIGMDREPTQEPQTEFIMKPQTISNVSIQSDTETNTAEVFLPNESNIKEVAPEK